MVSNDKYTAILATFMDELHSAARQFESELKEHTQQLHQLGEAARAAETAPGGAEPDAVCPPATRGAATGGDHTPHLPNGFGASGDGTRRQGPGASGPVLFDH